MHILQIQAYETGLLNRFINIVESTLANFFPKNAHISVTRMPTHVKRFTLLKSPHVNKTAREQFETRMYSCLIKVNATTVSTTGIERTIYSIVPPGVSIKYVHKTIL